MSALLQVGMGGGMEAGVNVWKALKDNHCVHKAWEHLAETPLTEEDLPRSITAITGELGPERSSMLAGANREATVQAGVKPAVPVSASSAAAGV